MSEKDKSNIKWILISANPAPLEFYRHLNRKTKRDVHDAYHLALSTILMKSEGVCKERLEMLKEIQKKWKNDDFKNDWNKYIAERSASESINASYKVQRSYNYEVSSYSLPKRKRSGPYTPEKPVIQPLKQLYPHVSFTKRAKIVSDKLHNENLVKNDSNQIEESENDDQVGKQGNHNENEENRDGHDNQDQVVAVDWREWLENILEFSIEEIRVQILSPYTAKNEFNHTMIKYIGKVLMDFVHKINDIPGHVMYIDATERDWIINKISPLFTYFQATFVNKICFHWIEHDVEPTHERLIGEGNTSNKDRLKADIVGVRLSDNRQVVFLEMSGAPTDFLKNHPIDDSHKTLRERIDSLNAILLNFLNYDIRFARKIRSLTIQGIRDRLTLRELSLRGKDDYVDEEILSAIFPLSWDFRFQFREIFNMMEYIILFITEYPSTIKELLKHPTDSQEFSIRYCIAV